MGEKIIPLGLARKRDEICGVIAHYERLIREAQQDLAHVNAALRLFEATGEAADLPPYVDLNRVGGGTRGWPFRKGVVYFIGAGKPTIAVKIGLTQEGTVEQRLRAIQCSNHEPLELLGFIGPALMPEVENTEKRLHTTFKESQLIIDGNVGHEWFRATEELLTYIEQHSQKPENFGLPTSVAKISALMDR